MPSKLYKVNDAWNTFEYLNNNLGYTKTPSLQVYYRSANDADWGSEAGEGFRIPYAIGDSSLKGLSFFSNGNYGWVNLNDLSRNYGLYPSDCLATELTKGAITSDAVYMQIQSYTYYLIRKDLAIGWVEENHLADYGWGHYAIYPDYIVIDENSGETVWSGAGQFIIETQITGPLPMQDTPFILIEEA